MSWLAAVHWIFHVTGCDYGLPYGHFSWYNLYSGIGGSYLIAGLSFGAALWFTHTCHASPWCLRLGKYPAAAGVFRLCRHHHPDLKGTRPHLELIHRLHAEHKARRP